MKTLRCVRRGSLGVVAFTLLLQAAMAQAATVKTKKNLYAPGESIWVDWEGFPAKGGDWITLAPAGSPANQYLGSHWDWTKDKSSGSMRFDGLPQGNYEVRGFFNWPTIQFVIQTRHTFAVGTTGASTIATDKKSYNPGEDIEVKWTNFPGDGSDWITIVPVGTPEDTYKSPWIYVQKGKTSGNWVIQRGLPVGSYEVRAYFGWGILPDAEKWRVRARNTFRVELN